jgi:predicted RNase H-like nuclease (RuvC/YqgF family)
MSDGPYTAHVCAESLHYQTTANDLRRLVGSLERTMEELGAERDILRADRDRLRAQVDTMLRVHDEVEADRDSARDAHRMMSDAYDRKVEECHALAARCERMTAVYEAALWYGRATHTDDANCAAGDHDDCEWRQARKALEAAVAVEQLRKGFNTP